LYHQAQELHEQGIHHLISIDEKTGIQAIERDYPTQPAETGQVARVEYNYDRHGTQALIANFEVATGKIISPTVEDTRTEVDFLLHLQQTVKNDPNGRWIFISDQLNTHKSASLVEWVAKECGVEEDLGVKGKSGILENMTTRAKFLQDASHRIHFVYTPKHCSWLNQVEIWFGILSRRLLKRGEFKSTAELKERILKFIDLADSSHKCNGLKINKLSQSFG
jgi:transposase